MSENSDKNDCSNCLWLNNLDEDNNHYGCSSIRYFNLHLKLNDNGEWVKRFNDKFYFVGNCNGHVESSIKNQKKLFNILIS